MTRRYKPKASRRTASVTVPLTASERSDLLRAAKDAGLTVSEYVRRRTLSPVA